VANLEKYNRTFTETFGVEEASLETLKYQGAETWDSVGHMSLIAALEDAFNISLDTDDIIDFSSYKAGKDILKKYKVEM
jgi:acyl carrier protein